MFYLEYIKDLVKENIISIVAIIFGVLCLIFAVGLFYYYNYVDSPKEDEIVVLKNEDESVLDKTEEVDTVIKVDVKGAVKNAGVYELTFGSNIQDAIAMAGGITSKGSTKNINLAKKLTDEMVIYVFTKDELKNLESSNEVVCEIPKCECETIVVNECPSIDETLTPGSDGETKDDDGKISINTATVEELTKLDGIGESKALAIIEYRNANGPFKAIEDIMNVSGIGESAFSKIKDKITV